MKLIFCAVLLTMILYPSECRYRGSHHDHEGDYGGPSGRRPGCGGQQAPQGGMLDQLSGLAQSLGLTNNGAGLQEMLAGLGQKLGLSSGGGGKGGQNPFAGLIQNAGSALGSGGGLKGLLQGDLRDNLAGKRKGSGSSGRRGGGRHQKFGSCSQGGQLGGNGYGSDFGGGQEEFGRPNRHGSYNGRIQGGHFGHRRQEDYDKEDY